MLPFCHRSGDRTAAGKRRCEANQWKRIWKGRRRAKRVNRPCKINSGAQKLTMTGIQLCSSLWPHCARSVHRTGQCDVQNLKMGTVVGKTQAWRLFHNRMVLLRKASATNCNPSRTSQRADHNVERFSMSTQGAEIERSG